MAEQSDTNLSNLSREIDSTEYMASYDESCKNLLAHKKILAYILMDCVEEFKGFELDYIAENCIENTPEVSTEPVHRNTKAPEKIVGSNTEDKTFDEGTVFYDIRFVATVPKTGESIRLIINLEAQKSYYPGYAIVRRGVYYGCRLVSSQHETEFTESNYDDIKKVYSIWICTDTPVYARNTVTKYKMTEENIIGNVKEKVENYDLINVVIICLDKDDENAVVADGVLGLLRTLLSDSMTAEKRKIILKENFSIKPDVTLEREMSSMCNLSAGVLEKGIEQGEELATLKAIKKLMESMSLTFEKAVEALGIPETEIEKYKSKL